MPWDFALILAILAIIVPLLGKRRVRRLVETARTSKLDRLTLYGSTMAFQWATAGIILWRAAAHRTRLDQLGIAIPRPALAVVLAISLSGLFLANQLFSLKRLSDPKVPHSTILTHFAFKVFPQDDVERLAFFALVSTVAICEELIYRGFAQFAFQQLTGLTVVAVVLSAILFSLAHAYQGKQGLASTLAVGLIFASVRAWTGSLVPSIAAHFVTDLTIGLLAPLRLRGNGPTDESGLDRKTTSANSSV